ncbi:MAG: HAMP domain-containing histidine kinase [Chloroflexota bacterium]|nr:HAMP domain-containing histidine kinase [Chloroflexota bacterium]
MKGQPLSLRLALVLSLAVVVVLLVTGLAVNRLVSRSVEDELTIVERQRLTLVATAVAEVDLSQPRAQRSLELILGRVAAQVRGRVELLAADGTLVAGAGRLPPSVGSEQLEEPVAGGGTLVIHVPLPDRAFLRVFNATLVIAGLLAVLVVIAASFFLSDRLTRPLREVAAAAHRLGGGDLSARASGGPDRESAELADAFNTMGERLERSEMLRRRAATDMAHDLATPATVLESQLQALVDGVLPADREQLDRARAAAGALSGVIVQLRDLVDAESATLSRRPDRYVLRELLGELERSLEPLFHETGLPLVVEAPADDVAVDVDRVQFSRALRNVLVNAVQHSPAGGVVQVMTKASLREVTIRVIDTGAGISQADMPHVFERFYRADEVRGASPARSGSGIGLTIARELLDANGGRIVVERTGPDGTTFAITLPRAAV